MHMIKIVCYGCRSFSAAMDAYFTFYLQFLEFRLKLPCNGNNLAGLFLIFWSNVQIISYYQVLQLRNYSDVYTCISVSARIYEDI